MKYKNNNNENIKNDRKKMLKNRVCHCINYGELRRLLGLLFVVDY